MGITTGVLKSCHPSLYDVGDLVGASERFPDTNAIRQGINQHIKGRGEFTESEIAEILGVPKLRRSQAVEWYGISYRVYDRLQSLLSLETIRGNLKRRKYGGVNHYTCEGGLAQPKKTYFEKGLYTKDDLIKVGQRFPSSSALREAINQLKRKEEFTVAKMANRLGIPIVWPGKALKEYGIAYNTYKMLEALLYYEARMGTLEKKIEGGRAVYSLEKAILLTSRHAVLPLTRRHAEKEKKEHPLRPMTREERQPEVMSTCLDAVNKVGPCTVRQVRDEIDFDYKPLGDIIRRLRGEGKIITIEDPGSGKAYKFFSSIFPKMGYLVLNPCNKNHLEKMSSDMIGCLPDSIYPWFIEHLDGQLDKLENAGLPKSVTDRVRNVYKKDITTNG